MNEATVKSRGYASISTPDAKYRMWVPRPTRSGRITCNCGFSLSRGLPFVDAISELKYVTVDEVKRIDKDFGTMVLQCNEKPGDCMERLLEDLPELMERYLVNQPGA